MPQKCRVKHMCIGLPEQAWGNTRAHREPCLQCWCSLCCHLTAPVFPSIRPLGRKAAEWALRSLRKTPKRGEVTQWFTIECVPPLSGTISSESVLNKDPSTALRWETVAGCAVPWRRWKTNILLVTATQGLSSSFGGFVFSSWCFWPRSKCCNSSFLAHPPSMGSCRLEALVAFLNTNEQLLEPWRVRDKVSVHTTDDPDSPREWAWCEETTLQPSLMLRRALVCIKIRHCSACLTTAKWFPSLHWHWNNSRFHYMQTFHLIHSNASALAVSSGKSCGHGAVPYVSNAHITSCLWM